MHNPAVATRRLGIITAPGWMDPNAPDLERLYPGQLHLQQTILAPPGFDYSFASIAASEPHLVTAATLLAEAGCELIIQDGPSFACLIGKTPAGARDAGERISQACGVPVVLNAVAILDELDHLGAHRVAVAAPYYSSEWKAMFTEFLRHGGYRIEAFQTFVEQSLFADQASVSARQYRFSDDEVLASLSRTRAAAPAAEAMIIVGTGIRTAHWIDRLERELGLPLVPADLSLYRAVMRSLRLTRIAAGPRWLFNFRQPV
jgi:maleate cis-trans isomerase